MIKKIVVLLFVTLLCGCCSKPNVEEINFSSWGSVTEVEILKKVIQNFEQENPSIKVNFMHIPQNYFQKMHLLFASKTQPDVIFINNIYLPLYRNYLEPLDSIIDKKDFYPQAIDSMTIDNKLLAIPRDVSNFVFYVNSDIVQNYENVRSLEDLILKSKSIQEQNVFGLSYEEDFLFVLPYITYFGENLTEAFEPQNSKALQYYKKLRDEYSIAPTKAQIGSSTLAQMFLDDKIAFYLSGRWMFPKISEKADFNCEVIQFPNGVNMLPWDSSGWALSKGSKHKESAVKLIKYLSNEKTLQYFAETGLVVPARIKTSQLLNNEEHNEKIFIEIIQKSKPLQIPVNYKKIADKVVKCL